MKKRGVASLKGFTLIELIVVMVIIGVLAAILVPAMVGYAREARIRKLTANARNVYSAAQLTLVEYSNNGLGVPGDTIFLGTDSSDAVSVDGTFTLSVSKFMGDDFKGNYGFKTSGDGTAVICSAWCDAHPLTGADVKIYTEDEIRSSISVNGGVGSHPYTNS